MRICQVCGEFYETRAGGLGTYVYRLSQNQVSLSHDVDIIAYDFGKPKYGADEGFTVYKTPLSRIYGEISHGEEMPRLWSESFITKKDMTLSTCTFAEPWVIPCFTK